MLRGSVLTELKQSEGEAPGNIRLLAGWAFQRRLLYFQLSIMALIGVSLAALATVLQHSLAGTSLAIAWVVFFALLLADLAEWAGFAWWYMLASERDYITLWAVFRQDP